MNSRHIGTARGILRNTAAQVLLGVLDKGAGLLVAVLVARFLGAQAMGLFALLFSAALMIQALVSLGLSESLVREVAANPRAVRDLSIAAMKLVASVAAIPCAALILAAILVPDVGATRSSLLLIAAGAPLGGLFLVSQAVLQGMERILHLTWVAIAARVFSLAFLVLALLDGAGVESAFASRALFHALAIAAYIPIILHRAPRGLPAQRPRTLLTKSVPFAAIGALQELGFRLPSFVLPGIVGLTASGIFDAANRIRSTLGMAVSASVVGLMPSLARSAGAAHPDTGGLVAYGTKYMCLGTAAAATVLAVLCEWIVDLLFGPAFAAASRPLQLLAWAQVPAAMAAVLLQTTLTHGASSAAIRHAGAGVLAQLVMIVGMTSTLGLEGAACAALLGSLLTLTLSLRFVARTVAPIPLWRFALAPLTAAAGVGTALLAASGEALVTRCLVAAAAWTVAIVSLRILPRHELRFMKEFVTGRGERLEQLTAD
jgi:O-antigen/teichoic acid export membrane protein